MVVKLGQKVKDRCTGLEGTVLDRTEYLDGTVDVLIEVVKDGEPQRHLLDEWGLEAIAPPVAEEPQASAPKEATSGGPHSAPRRAISCGQDRK